MDNQAPCAAAARCSGQTRYFDPLAITIRLGAHAPRYDRLAVDLAERRWAWLAEDDVYRQDLHDHVQGKLADYLLAAGQAFEFDGSGLMGILFDAFWGNTTAGEQFPQLKARARAHAAARYGLDMCAPRALHLRSSVHPFPPAHHLDPTTPSRGSSLSPPRRLGTHSARPLDSGEKFTREWVYDVVLDQMVGALEAHGPDAPQAEMVEAPEAPEGVEAVEAVGEAEAAEEAEDGMDVDALSTSLADSDLGRRIALALADSGGTGPTQTHGPVTGTSGAAL